jgi:replicative DNA helicase Mcm
MEPLPDFYKKIAPWLLDCDFPKKVVALQAFSNPMMREKLHILLIGEPASGKSELVRYMYKIRHKSNYCGLKTTPTGLVEKAELSDGGLLCLHPSSRILLNDKYMSIEDAYNKQEKGNIVSYSDFTVKNAKIEKLTRRYFKGELISLSFKSGFKLKMTPEHLLLNGNNLEWKSAGDFKVNDLILAPLKFPDKGDDTYLIDVLPTTWKISLEPEERTHIKSICKIKKVHIPKFLDKSRRYGISISEYNSLISALGIEQEYNKKPSIFFEKHKAIKTHSTTINEDLAYLIGFTFGDGHRTKKGTYTITQSSVHRKQIDLIKLTFSRVFGKNPNIYIQMGGRYTANDIALIHTNKLFGAICDYYFKNLDNILALNNKSLASFFAGLIDADGCISIKKNGKYLTPSIDILASNDLYKNQVLSLALRRFDCRAKIVQRKTKVKDLQISSASNLKPLIEVIKGKCIKFKELPKQLHNVEGDTDVLPSSLVAKELHNINYNKNTQLLLKDGMHSTFHDFKYQKRNPHRLAVAKLCISLAKFCPTHNLTNLTNMCNRDYFLEEIIDVNKEKYEGYVYDLVIPETHNFMAEGVIVHNCVDEFDKLSREIRNHLLEIMEHQMITIDKYMHHETKNTRVNILACCNPTNAKLEDTIPIHHQLPFTQREIPLMTRFHLFIPFKAIDTQRYEDISVSHNFDGDEQDAIMGELKKAISQILLAFPKITISEEMSREAGRYITQLGEYSRMNDIISPRTIDGFKTALKARARMNLRTEPSKLDFDYVKHMFEEVYFPEGIR